jgi:hypothetical protein
MVTTPILLLLCAAMPPSERKTLSSYPTCHVTSIDSEMRLLVRQDFTVLEPCAQVELSGSL